MLRLWVLNAAAAVAVGAYAGCRFASVNNCLADGSTVWFEKANSQGNYEGIDNNLENCK